MQAHVTAASQSLKLRGHMEEANIRHGQAVRADIPNVRVVAATGRGGDIFFCNMGPIRVKEVLASGDHGALPTSVVLDGVDFPAAGEFDITDALISANGDIRISADGRTRVHSRSHLISQLQRGSIFAT